MPLTAEIKFGKWGGPYQVVQAEGVTVQTLRHHDMNLQQTASGYGKKLATPYMIKYKKRWRRVYCVCFSNVGTNYVIIDGKHVVCDIDQ